MTNYVSQSKSDAPQEFYLEFNNDISFGSSEHFYHYMWGYLLPSIHEITKLKSQNLLLRNLTILFKSCGPVIDNITHEVATLLKYTYRIIPGKTKAVSRNVKKISVPRWDVWLANFEYEHIFKEKTIYEKIKNKLLRGRHPIDKTLFSELIFQVKTMLIEKANAEPIRSELHCFCEKYLILNRSPQPEYYDRGGNAEISSYGTGRRALTGLENAKHYLSDRDIPISIFEPGAFGLVEQIQIFNNCKGVIGIIGAEFANIIWMKPNRNVVRILPLESRHLPPITKNLSHILNLEFSDIYTSEGKYPTLQPEAIERLLR